MNSSSTITNLLTNYATQLPILLVCIVAIVAILSQTKMDSSVTLWALLGFGLTLAIAFVAPVSQVLVMIWAIQGDAHNYQKYAWLFTLVAGFWTLLRAVGYGFLLAAILAGRAKADAAPQVVKQ